MKKDVFSPKDKRLLKKYNISFKEFLKGNKKEQQALLSYFTSQENWEDVLERARAGWELESIREGLKYLKRMKRILEEEMHNFSSKKKKEFNFIEDSLRNINENIDYLQSLHHEAVFVKHKNISLQEESQDDHPFEWTIVGFLFIGVFAFLMFLPSFGFFESCLEKEIFSRPICILLSYPNQNNISNIEQKSEIFEKKEEVDSQLYKSAITQEQANLINSGWSELENSYSVCVNFIQTKTNLIPQIRDQATLYQYDGDVEDCVLDYISRAKVFSELVFINYADSIKNEYLFSYQQNILSQSSRLRILSTNYVQLSKQRHNYIHGVHQTNEIIRLIGLIGEETSSVASGDVIGSIDSLYSLYDWVYKNGGVIDTGWGLSY